MSAEVKLSIPPQQYAEMVALISLDAGRITREQFINVMVVNNYPIEAFSERNYDDQIHHIARSVLQVIIK
jgi:hypothetical protein